MRRELFWDMPYDSVSPEVEIERAINFGGFAYIEEVQKKYGIEKFKQILIGNRNLSKRAVSFWCLKLGIDRAETKAFSMHNIWTPMR